MRESQSNLLWIAVFSFVFHHTPDDVDHLSSQANQCLRFRFTLGYLSGKVSSSFLVSHSRYLRQSHAVESTVETAIAGPCLFVPPVLARRAFSRRTACIFRQGSRRFESRDVADFSDDRGGDSRAATGSGLQGVAAFFKEDSHLFFELVDLIMQVYEPLRLPLHRPEQERIA